LRCYAILPIALALAAQAFSAPPKVVVVDIDGMVHPITVDITADAIALAKQEGAALVIVRLNTPGGLMDAMRETIEKIVSSPVPVVTYVGPSGGRAAWKQATSPPWRRARTRVRRTRWRWAERWTP
jgi:membrane-bound serine protease (ClpP class)